MSGVFSMLVASATNSSCGCYQAEERIHELPVWLPSLSHLFLMILLQLPGYTSLRSLIVKLPFSRNLSPFLETFDRSPGLENDPVGVQGEVLGQSPKSEGEVMGVLGFRV